jgi:hypothetical protein
LPTVRGITAGAKATFDIEGKVSGSPSQAVWQTPESSWKPSAAASAVRLRRGHGLSRRLHRRRRGSDQYEPRDGQLRGQSLYGLDRKSTLRFSHENLSIGVMYDSFVGSEMAHRVHELLHTDHNGWQMPLFPRLQGKDPL